MRIFVASVQHPDSFADNVAATLRDMGHEVATEQPTPLSQIGGRFRAAWERIEQRLAGQKMTARDRALHKAALAYRPEVLLCTTNSVHPETLHALRAQCGTWNAIWWGDVPGNAARFELLDPAWDAVFVKDRSVVSRLAIAGRSAVHLHEAMNPAWHKPVAGQTHEGIVIHGTCYAYRQALIARLDASGVPVRVYGPPPPLWALPAVRRLHAGKYIVREEKSRIFGEARAVVNSFALTEPATLNCRAFETAGAGALQVIENRPAVAECFEPGNELLTYDSFEELTAHLDRARRFPAETKPIREAGARRALAEHTYRHRLEKILATR